eukprot:451767_1
MTSQHVLYILVSLSCSDKLQPFWSWNWDTLPVWASSTFGAYQLPPDGFNETVVEFYSQYQVTWTQGLWDLNNTVPGYTNFENSTVSDATKLHNYNNQTKYNMFVGAYYGFPGCCLDNRGWWITDYLNATKNNDLYLRDDIGKIVVWTANGGKPTPYFNFCNNRMITYFNEIILSSFIESNEINGIFFDECNSYIEPGNPGSIYFNKAYNFSNLTRQYEIENCYANAMYNISLYIISFNKWPIPSSIALYNQYTNWWKLQSDLIINYGGFQYIEIFNCFGNGNIVNISNQTEWNKIINTQTNYAFYNTNYWKQSNNLQINNKFKGMYNCPNKSNSECCQDMILSLIEIASKGGATMIRGPQETGDYNTLYYQISAFLLTAYKYSYFAGGNGWNGPSSFPWFDIYNYPLGEPLGNAVFHDINKTIITRQFENAYIAFNLTNAKSIIYFNWNNSIGKKTV